MDSTEYVYRRIVSSLAVGLLALGLFGCATGTKLTTAAPRSNVSRDKALTMAKQVAASIGGRVYVIAPSGSMLPTLDEGSIVTVEIVALDKLKKGDIIIYRNATGAAVIHRLYERHDNRWYVLGDNNASVDRETVSAGNFLGRVCAIFYTASDGARISDSTSVAPLTAVASAQ